MLQSYTNNYIKIYIWQGFAMILNFFSMLVVLPYLTSDPIVFGVYSVCISFSIFLSYADLGFIGAGQKYAAEYFAKGDREAEVEIIGFTIFILGLFLILFSGLFIYFSNYPKMFVRGIENSQQENIASSLLIILALFTPTTLLQRLTQMICGIRMEDFIVQRVNIIGNFVKIASVFWFFRTDSSDIVSYFFFTQIINFLSQLIALLIIKKRYQYNFNLLIQSFRFNKKFYKKTRTLAFASIIMTSSWILYYEFDSFVIGQKLGAMSVAVYSIGLTVLSFFRSIFGIIFSPFSNRFNHFIGKDDEISLTTFYTNIVVIFAPVVTFPIISIALLSKPIVMTWVGSSYIDSIGIIQLLIFCNIFAFITYPTNFILFAKQREKELYITSFILPVVFWCGVILTINFYGIYSFAAFKLVAFLVSAIHLIKILMLFLNISILVFVKKFLIPMFFPVVFLFISCLLVKDYLPLEKSKLNLFIVAIIIAVLLFVSFLIQYFSSEKWRSHIIKIINQLKFNRI